MLRVTHTTEERRVFAALFFRLPIVLALSITLISPLAFSAVDEAPNIIIILADDMGYGDIGVNSDTVIRTPNIDRLAKSGLNFANFYASANVCTPSRAGLMTGRYAIRSGLAKGVLSAESKSGLPESEETIAELAKRAGLSTSLIGKWHLGTFPDYHPQKHGWDEFYGTPHSNDMPNFALFDGSKEVENPVTQSTLTQRYTDKAVDFITRNNKKPFLLMLSHNMPHIPLYASKPYQGKSAAGTYGDVIEEMDAGVGVIVETLKKLGIDQNTLILFTSDNGPFFEGSVGNMKGGKGNGWDGGYRVPAVLSWPTEISTARAVKALSSNLDLLPTLAEVLKVKPKARIIDGRSLLRVIRGAEESPHENLYYFNNEEIIGLRSQRWKLLTHVYYRRSLGAFEKFDQLDGFQSGYDMLFDMSSQRGEQYSVADRHPKVLGKMKSKLHKVRKLFEPLMLQEPDETFPR